MIYEVTRIPTGNFYRETYKRPAPAWKMFAATTSDLRAGQHIHVLEQQADRSVGALARVTHVDHVWGYVRIDTLAHGPIDVPLDALDEDSSGVYYRLPAL